MAVGASRQVKLQVAAAWEGPRAGGEYGGSCESSRRLWTVRTCGFKQGVENMSPCNTMEGAWRAESLSLEQATRLGIVRA